MSCWNASFSLLSAVRYFCTGAHSWNYYTANDRVIPVPQLSYHTIRSRPSEEWRDDWPGTPDKINSKMVTMATNDCTDLQLPDGAYISIIHDHIARSEVTEYMVQLMRLPAGDMGSRTGLHD